MGLLDLIDKELIINPLTSSTKESVINDLVEKYAKYASLSSSEKDEILQAVLDRESLGSTAMEKGIAMPHAKIKDLKKAVVVIGISRIKIDFGGDEKSDIFFLVLAPDENPQEHILTLSSIARLCSSDIFVRMLHSSRSVDEVYQLFFD